jgi:hypothetical protein
MQEAVETRPRTLTEEYAPGAAEEVPLAAYATLVTIFSSLVTAGLVLGARRRALPSKIVWRDIALLGIATHRVARLLTRDTVAAPLRAPFTRRMGKAGAGEQKDRPRGTGFRRALGKLLTCQYCADPWISLALTTAFVARPRETRILASGVTVATVSDFLHQAYAFVRKGSS